MQAHGYQQFNLAEFKVEAGKPTRELVMPLLRGFIVRGRVFDLGTGAGIPDARISFRLAAARNDGGRPEPYSKSKDDGSFTLDGVPGGEILLTVGAQEHAFRTLGIVVDDKTQPQDIALSTGGTIAGSVRTTSGEPATGKILLNGPGPGFFDKTDEAGRFAFKHRGAGRYSVTANTAAGSASHDFLLMQDERKEDIVLVVGAGRSVRGVVRGLRPEQMSKTHIMLRPESDSGFFSASPDAHGAYALNGVPPGHAVISVYGPSLQFDKTVEVPADQDVALDIVFPTGARLSDRVTKGGEPVVSKNVWMRPAEDKTDTVYQAITSADGQYEIEGLPPGDYRLRADEDISRTITMAGDAVLNIDIPSVQLSARVREDGGA
ncbi:MAG: hypothetical protein ACREXP_27320, partial [Steroidobacteraceae bacterium]